VFLLEPQETRWDLRWRMFGTPVRVHPLFWLIALLLGFDAYRPYGNGYLLMWVGCVFFSILLHEFGHVLMGRLFGSHGYVVLYSLGGMAVGSNQLARRWQRILVSLAGPLAQLAFIGVLFAILWWARPPVNVDWKLPVALLLHMLLFINVFWAVLNLLPIWPLDGGQVTREICVGAVGERGVYHSLGISLVVSGILMLHVIVALWKGRQLIPYIGDYIGADWFMVLFFAMFFINSLQGMQAESARGRHWTDDDVPWRR
jgi:stage IV sporulation protein FB